MASRAVGQACMHGFMGLSWAVLYGCPPWACSSLPCAQQMIHAHPYLRLAAWCEAGSFHVTKLSHGPADWLHLEPPTLTVQAATILRCTCMLLPAACMRLDLAVCGTICRLLPGWGLVRPAS